MTIILTVEMYHPADPPGPPDAPLISDIFAENCMCAWQPPKEDGGAPITGYHLEKRLIGSQFWARVNKEKVSVSYYLPCKNCLILLQLGF